MTSILISMLMGCNALSLNKSFSEDDVVTVFGHMFFPWSGPSTLQYGLESSRDGCLTLTADGDNYTLEANCFGPNGWSGEASFVWDGADEIDVVDMDLYHYLGKDTYIGIDGSFVMTAEPGVFESWLYMAGVGEKDPEKGDGDILTISGDMTYMMGDTSFNFTDLDLQGGAILSEDERTVTGEGVLQADRTDRIGRLEYAFSYDVDVGPACDSVPLSGSLRAENKNTLDITFHGEEDCRPCLVYSLDAEDGEVCW